jgi:hypothetical protein
VNRCAVFFALLTLTPLGRLPDLWAAPASDAGRDQGLVAKVPADGAFDAIRDAARDAAKKLPGWAPRLTATVTPVQVHLGDPITMTIKVRHRQGVSVNLPLKLELGKFHELAREETSREIGAKGEIPDVERTFVLKVASYELGEHTLPAVEVTALGPNGELIALPTVALPIVIKSLMGNEPTPKLKALEPPIPVYQRTWWFLYLMIGLASDGIIVIATLLVSRHLRQKRARQKPPPPPVPPHVVALGRLAELEVDRLILEERYKELYLLLSEIMRDYVGRRWGFDALEMTTTEIRGELQRLRVSAEVQQQLELYFNNCDLVKFAKYCPTPEGARLTYHEAETLVRQTALTEVAPRAAGQQSPAVQDQQQSANRDRGPA